MCGYRHNTELLHAVPDALQQKAALAAEFDRKLRERQAEVQRGCEARVSAVKAAAAEQVAAVEERTRAAEERCEADVQAARRAARVARDDAVALVGFKAGCHPKLLQQ